MKKIIWLVFLVSGFFFVSKTILVSHRIYISSIYLDKQEEYELVFFSPSALSVGKSESSGTDENTTISMKGDTLEDVFNKVEMSTDFELNYRHIVSVIFSKDFLHMDTINSFISFIVKSEYIDFNFYVFTTSTAGDELFTFKNPDNTSTYYSILNVTSDSEYLFNYISALDFVRFLRLYSKKNFLLKIPEVNIEETYLIGSEISKNLNLSGVTIFKKYFNRRYSIEEEPFLLFLNSFDKGKYYIEDKQIVINEVDIKSIKKDKLVFNITVNYKALFANVNTDDVKSYIFSGVSELLNELYAEGVDYLGIDDINQKYKTNYAFSDIELKIKLKHN